MGSPGRERGKGEDRCPWKLRHLLILKEGHCDKRV